MKSITFFLLIFSALFLTINSCKKDDLNSGEWGEAKAQRNGEVWESKPRCLYNQFDDNKINFTTTVYNVQGFRREEIYFVKIPLEVGNYKISRTRSDYIDDLKGATYYTSVDDGDVVGDAFRVSENDSTSFINVTRVKDEEVWGTFELTVIRDTTKDKQTLDLPEILHFTEGEFHTKILD